jgi:hypothetical protein
MGESVGAGVGSEETEGDAFLLGAVVEEGEPAHPANSAATRKI